MNSGVLSYTAVNVNGVKSNGALVQGNVELSSDECVARMRNKAVLQHRYPSWSPLWWAKT